MARRLIVEIVGDASSLQRALGSASASADSFGSRMSAAGGKISAFGARMTRDVTLPIVGIGVVATKSAVDFQKSMELLHTQAGVSQQSVDALSKSVLAMAGSVATSPEELSLGIYHLASQGLRGARALDALKVAAEGAKLGGANLEDVTNALGAAIVANIGGVKNYSQAMGQLNAIVGSGDMHMQDLADAMGTGLAAVAKTAHVSLDQVGGALATFGDNNIRGAKAGTLLISTMRVLGHQSTAAKGALADLGVSSDTLQAKLASGGLTSAIGYLNDRIKESGKSTHVVSSDLSEAFGGKQSTGIKILIDEFDRLQRKVKQVSDGGNQFASDWEAYTKTTAYHLASMGAQMKATGVTIGDVLLPVVAKLADIIGGLAQKFEALSPGTRRFIMIGAGIAAVIGPLVGFIGSLTTAIGGLSTAFMFIAANPVVLVIAGIAALGAAIAAAVIWPDKLKSVLEHMGLSAQTSGEIVDGLREVFNRLKAAGEALVSVVRSNWSTISAIIQDAVDVVRTVVTTTATVVEALWRTFGSTLTSIARTEWGYIKGTIKNALEVIRGVVDLISGLIHGDWSKVWKGIEEIVGGTVNQILNILRTAVSLLGETAQLIGTAIWQGIIQPIAHLAGELLHKIEDAATHAFHTIIGWIVGEAEQIGEAISHGIMSGLGGLAGGLFGKLKDSVGGALHSVKSFLGIGSPSRVFHVQVGEPIAQGIIAGYLEGISPLTGKMSASLRASLEQARAVIRQEQTQVADAWRQLADAVVSAFDKETEQGLERIKGKLARELAAIAAPANKTSSQLQAMQDQDRRIQLAHDLANATQAVAQAQDAYNQALQSGDPSQIAAAQQQLADAQYNLTMVQRQQQEQQLQDKLQAEQKKADAEKKAAEARAHRQEADFREQRKRQRKNLEDNLKDLGTALEHGRLTWAQAHSRLMALLDHDNIDYRAHGKSAGASFAQGIRDSLGSVETAMKELAKLVAQYLPHSPAEKGPLSKPIGWQSYLMGGLPSAAAGVSSLLGAGLSTPTAYAGAGAGRVEVHVHLHGGTYLGGNQQQLANDLVDPITSALVRAGSAGHPYWKNLNRLGS